MHITDSRLAFLLVFLNSLRFDIILLLEIKLIFVSSFSIKNRSFGSVITSGKKIDLFIEYSFLFNLIFFLSF